MLPTTIETLYWPPCLPRPLPLGNRSFGALGTRPELLTISDELATPVPFPLPTNKVSLTNATADGYCPVGIKPRTRLTPAPLRDEPELSSDVGERPTTA